MNTQTQTPANVTPVKKGDSIVIIGRRWFERTNGNTYHSATVLLNGKEVAHVPFAYGYDSQYIYTGANELHKLGYLPGWTENTVFWRYCEDNGITLSNHHTDVKRKKDL